MDMIDAGGKTLSKRVYVCHTFYHVYIACLKEFYFNDGAGADLILSKMSNRFGTMVDRARNCPVFNNVYEFDEKEYTEFPDLVELKTNAGNIVSNMLKRIKFCKELARHTEALVPVDMKQYRDIYVFCDSDPIGYYLSYKKIRYHAVGILFIEQNRHRECREYIFIRLYPAHGERQGYLVGQQLVPALNAHKAYVFSFVKRL